jgi:hypothetical protein
LVALLKKLQAEAHQAQRVKLLKLQTPPQNAI